MHPADRRAFLANYAIAAVYNHVRHDDKLFFFIRHGQNGGGQDGPLTPRGREQVIGSICQICNLFLLWLGRRVMAIHASGKVRTMETATLMLKTLKRRDLKVAVNPGLSPFPLHREMFPGNAWGAVDEIPRIRAVKDTVAHALQVSEYARAGSEVVRQTILDWAAQMQTQGHRTAIGISHSPWCELAAPASFANLIPYGMEEGGCTIYTVRDEQIVFATYIPAPLAGDRN